LREENQTFVIVGGDKTDFFHTIIITKNKKDRQPLFADAEKKRKKNATINTSL